MLTKPLAMRSCKSLRTQTRSTHTRTALLTGWVTWYSCKKNEGEKWDNFVCTLKPFNFIFHHIFVSFSYRFVTSYNVRRQGDLFSFGWNTFHPVLMWTWENGLYPPLLAVLLCANVPSSWRSLITNTLCWLAFSSSLNHIIVHPSFPLTAPPFTTSLSP